MWGWGEGTADGGEGGSKGMKECCRPLKVEIFEIEDKAVLKEWKTKVEAEGSEMSDDEKVKLMREMVRGNEGLMKNRFFAESMQAL